MNRQSFNSIYPDKIKEWISTCDQLDPNTLGVDKQWKHWLKTFENFLVVINSHTPDKLVTLTNYIAPNMYEYTVDCATYEEAIEVLKGLYVNSGYI